MTDWIPVAQAIFAEAFGDVETRTFSVRYGSGDASVLEQPFGRPTTWTLVLPTPDGVRHMFLPPSELSLVEAFIRGEFDIEGDIEQATQIGKNALDRLRSIRRLTRVGRLLLQLGGDHSRPQKSPEDESTHSSEARSVELARHSGRKHALARDADAIRFHYDVGNDFYGLWLDEQRVYSCAYFETGTEDIDAAQRAKLEHICRKLRLQPGERLLDIGCGWGALIRHAARAYGVQAVGVTLSPSQAEYAVDRIAREGLSDRCRVEVMDYRGLRRDAPFDKVVSVGMFEHVGHEELPNYFTMAYALTKPGGLFLNHGIVTLAGARPETLGHRIWGHVWRQGEFIDRYVFPDGELVPLATAVRDAEAVGFETRDVESLREHYARTLRLWGERLTAREREARAIVGEATYRVWRLYMAASAHAFAAAEIGLDQILFAKPDPEGRSIIPPTRADLYQARSPGRS